MKSKNGRPYWWLGSAINLTAAILAVVSTWLYRQGIVHETVFKVPRFLRPVRDHFGDTGLYVAIFVMACLAWWVAVLIVAAKLFPAAFDVSGDHSSHKP